MGFRCDAATLERLEWNRLLLCLSRCASTERGARACLELGFEATHSGVAERLAETSEIRRLLDAGESLPFGGVSDLRPLLELLSKGQVATAGTLADVRANIEAALRLRNFLESRSDRLPALADLAQTLPDLAGLARAIERVISPEGSIRGDASSTLKKLRRQVRDLEAEIDKRMNALLRDSGLRVHLQDHFATQREGRAVLPVRAESKGAVRGIVHDVSSSGTTVFIEPETVVEAGNRLRLARREIEREEERLLRELSRDVGAESASLAAAGNTLQVLDVASARGRISQQLDAREPRLENGEPLAIRSLCHPLLQLEAGLNPEEIVANDMELGPGEKALIISGPNAGGKTVAAKAVGLAALSIRAGLHLPCGEASRLPIFDAVAADIGDEQDLRSGLSTFSARMSNLARIAAEADDSTLIVVDEIGEGTEPAEGAALAQSLLEAFVDRGATVIATTHFNRLKELAGNDGRFRNASADFDSDTLLPTYRIHLGVPGSSGAAWVAERMGVAPEIVSRARGLLDREDRRLEALTRSLSELRQELEGERQMATHVRAQSERTREEYEERLEQLRGARREAVASMNAELESAYRSARDELAAIMRQVQKGGESGQAASRAYQELDQLKDVTEAVSREHAEPEAPAPAVDWTRIEEGARLELEGLSAAAVLLEKPDRRGRIVVRVGGTRTELPAERVRRVLDPVRPIEPTPRRHVDIARSDDSEGDEVVPECDLRGLRVDEAIDRAEAQLQKLLGRGSSRIRFIHGHGTGALRSAIRSWLRDSAYVESFAPGSDHDGGNGVTIATLAH